MSFNLQSVWNRVRVGRIRILWLVLGAMLLVSAGPLGLYHRQVLHLSQGKLTDNERVQQNDLTRSLEISPENSSVWRERGLAEMELRELGAALSDLDRALALAPRDGNAWAHRAACAPCRPATT